MDRKKKLSLLLISLILVVGLVAAIWKFSYDDDSKALVESGDCPWSEIMTFDDMYLNATDNNATDSTKLVLKLRKSFNNVRVGFYTNVENPNLEMCNHSGDCSSNLSHNSNPIYHNDLINMIQGNNTFNLSVSCKWTSCEANLTYTLNLTEE